MSAAGTQPIPCSRVYLVGFMGAGKSTIGPLLARRLRWSFVDTDAMIEEAEGRKVARIFAEDGEPRFRELETAAISRTTGREDLVVSLGGGALIREENRGILRQAGRTVYLFASLDALVARLKNSRTRRPLLAGAETVEQLEARVKSLFEARSPLFEACDLKIRTDDCRPEQVASRIEAALRGKQS